MAASTSQRLESFLTDALGAEALKALRAAISREPRLAKAMPQRALLSWAIAAIRHDFQGQVPGQEDMHISLRKTEAGFQGLLQTPAGRQTLGGDLLTVVAGLALALELEADDSNSSGWTDIGRQAAARLGKSLDQLAQTRLIRKEIELQKGFPRDEQENRDNHNSHLVLQDALLEGGKTVAEPSQQVDIPPGLDKRGKPVKDTKARQGRIDQAAYDNSRRYGLDFDTPKSNTSDTGFWATIGEQTSDAALRDVPPYIIDLGQGRTVPVHFSGGFRPGIVNLTVPTTPLVDGLHPSGRTWEPGDLSAMTFPLGELGRTLQEKRDFNPGVGSADLPEISQDVFSGAGVRAMGNHLHAHRDAIHAHLQQHLPRPTLLGKAERTAGWLPAFRHEQTGKVHSCPEGYHDLNVLPEGNDQGYSTGFVDPEGNFFSREETKAKLGLNGMNSGALHAKQLEKMHATPTFPKLGMPDNRRETDIVTTPRQVEIKRRSQAASIRHIVKPENQAHYDLPEGTSAADAEVAAKGLMDDHLRGALGSVASGPFPGAHAHGDSRQRQLYNTLNPDVQDFNSALVDPSGKSTRSTQMHEDLHGMLGRVSEKYGTYARQNLSANLFKWAAYRAPAAAHAVFQSLRRWYDFKPGQQPHEELLASTLNMVNSPANRRDLQMRLGLDDDQMRQLQDKFKVFHQHMLEGGKLADLRWLDDGSFSGWLQGRPEEEIRSTNTGVRSDQLSPLPFLLNKTPAEQLREDLLNRPKPKHFLDDQRPNLNKGLPSREESERNYAHEQVLQDHLRETFPVESHVQPNVDKRYNRLDEIPDLKERASRGTAVDPKTGVIKDRGPIKDSGARRTRAYTAELGNRPTAERPGWEQYGGRDVNDNFDAVDAKILNENVRPPELGDLTFEWRSPTGAAESIGSWTESVVLPASPTETPTGAMWPADENADPEIERQRRKPRYIVAWNRGGLQSRWGEGPISGVYLVNVNGRVSQHYGPEQPAVLQHLQNHVDSIGPDRWYGDLSTPEALRRPSFLKSDLSKGWPRSEAENQENQQADIRNPVAQDQLLSGLPPGSTVSETEPGPGSAGTEGAEYAADIYWNNVDAAGQWNENQDNYYRQLQMPHSFGAMFDSEVQANAFPLESLDHPVLGHIDFEWDRRSHFARAAGSTNNADVGWGIIGTTPSGINTLHAITPEGRIVSHPESLQGLRRVGSDAPVPEAGGWDAEVAAHLQQQLDRMVPPRQWQPLKPGDMDLGKSLRKADDPLAAHHVLWDKLMEKGWHLYGLSDNGQPHTLKLLNPRVFNTKGQNILGGPAEPGEVVEMMTHGPGAKNWTGSPAFYNYGVSGQMGTTPHHQFDAQAYLQQLDAPPPPTPPAGGGKPVEKKDLMPGGKADGRPDSDFPPAALKQGTATEQEEHGLDRQRASEVAKDHLVEDPQYYRDEHLEKGWPRDEQENQANRQGFLNQPVAQDQYLEGTGAQPQTHGEQPTDANWPPRNERGFWAGHWDAYEANRAQNGNIRDSTGRQSRGFYEPLDQPSFDSEVLSDIHPLPRYPRVEFGVRRVEGPARFGDLFGSLTRFGDTPASGVVLTAWNSGAGEDLAHWRLGGDEGPVLLAGNPSQHLHEHVLNHYRDANRFFKTEELAKKGLEVEEDDLADLGYARPDDFQVAAELQDQRNKSNWMQSKNFNVSRQVAGGAPKPAPKPRPPPKVDVPRRQAGKLNPEYQQKYQQQDDAKAKAAARARAYRQRQAQAQGREIKAKPEKPMTAQERYAKWAASDKGKATLKEKKASDWAALTDEQKAGKALALRLWRAGQKAKAGTLQKGWPRSEVENRDNQAGFVRESPPTEDRLMEQLPEKTQHGTAANYKIDVPRLPVAAKTSRSVDVDPDWFSVDNRRRTWEAYDSNTASQERELREGGNPPVFRGFDHGSIHSSDRGADVEDDNLNVPQNAMLRAAGQMHLVERPENDFWQMLSARADAAAKRKNIANGRSALNVTPLPKEIAEKMDKVELPGQTHQPTKQQEPLAPEAPEMQPAIAGLQTKKRGGQ